MTVSSLFIECLQQMSVSIGINRNPPNHSHFVCTMEELAAAIQLHIKSITFSALLEEHRIFAKTDENIQWKTFDDKSTLFNFVSETVSDL